MITHRLGAAGAGVALAALHLGHVHAQVDRMLEGLRRQRRADELRGRALGEDRVAGVAVVRDNLAAGAAVLRCCPSGQRKQPVEFRWPR
ncbi:MAG: hypothetical protein HY598_02020 [Candidatus Omnitrophica bacterium]|nr:hypothetical protein [Candidatus Omnitrophota bacterium]